jgi:hypothetical protein
MAIKDASLPFVSLFDVGVDIDVRFCIPYVLRRIPRSHFSSLLPAPIDPQVGDVALAEVQSVGRNTFIELTEGRRRALHAGDLLAVAFGNRYATAHYEGYARANADLCDMLSVGGMCGLVKSKHAGVSEPTRLRLLGAIADGQGRSLRMGDFKVQARTAPGRLRTVAVCGTSMDSGKTFTASCVIAGLSRSGHRVAGIKLTGSAAGRDTWSLLDAGSCTALDFIDGGLPSTYLCSGDRLIELYELLVNAAASEHADFVVVEIADGLLQRETRALLQDSRFVDMVDAFIVTASDSLGALGAVNVLREWNIDPIAVSGLVSMSPLHVTETHLATRLPCLTGSELETGALNGRIASGTRAIAGAPGQNR